MKRIVACLVVALSMMGCGGTSDTPTDPLDPGFAKTWTGDFSMTCTGVGTTVYPGGTSTITVSGNSLTAVLSCTDGSGTSVTATGSGRTASWSGSVSCPPTVQGSCSTWVFTRTSVTYTLNANGSLSGSGVGTLVGCGITTDCTTSFSGI